MSGNSGLAAVHAAASPALEALAPVTSPAPLATQALASTTLTELVAAYPDLCAQLRADGAALERTRILGIEAHAMPGHEKLIGELKADGNITPDMAAGRILAAERTARGLQLQGIADVEKLTGKVPAAPTSQIAPPSDEKATTPEGWKTEFAASSKLQSEFVSVEDYVAFKKADANGSIRVRGSAAK